MNRSLMLRKELHSITKYNQFDRKKCKLCMKTPIQACYYSSKSNIQWSSNEIRKSFIDYFSTTKDHQFVKSSSIIPPGERLNVVNAGMNQFKPLFLNTLEPDHPFNSLTRAVNSQKCIRMSGKHNDLSLVGKSLRHHTFFEMLGNWSFGDYYKTEACKWAWQLLTEVWKIDPNRLFVTYFAGDQNYNLGPDEETKDIWLSMGVPKDRVIALGSTDNFWKMGSTGPCGPCTEIHYIINPSSSYESDDDMLSRAIEIWNLVFIQYNFTAEGALETLPKKHVDTGMGLERIASILQTEHKNSNYDTDLFQPLFEVIENKARVRPYQGSLTDPLDISYRIVADHARMIAVAMSDGLKPGTASSPHKLRKIIRTANWHIIAVFKQHSGRFLLTELASKVAEILGDTYPELREQRDYVSDTIINEINMLRYQLQKQNLEFKNFSKGALEKGSNVMPGDVAYKILQQFGTSKEMLAHLAEKHGLVIDFNEFDRLHEEKVNHDKHLDKLHQLKKLNN